MSDGMHVGIIHLHLAAREEPALATFTAPYKLQVLSGIVDM